MRKNSAIILIIVKVFLAVMYQIPLVNDRWLPVISGTVIKTYSGLFKHIQHPVKSVHIHNINIFQVELYLQLEVYTKTSETFMRHIKNPVIVRTIIMIVIITLTFFFTLILHNFQQNLKRHMFFGYSDINFNARLSLLK